MSSKATTLCAVSRHHHDSGATGRPRVRLMVVACVAAILGAGPVLSGVATAQGDPPETTSSTTSTTEATTSTTEAPTTTSTTEAPTTTVPPDPEPTSPPTTAPTPTTSVTVPTTVEPEVGRVVTEGTVLSPSAGQLGANPDGGETPTVADTGGGWFSPANQVRMAVGSLVALALVTVVLTVAYWRHTRPDGPVPDRTADTSGADDDPVTLSSVGSGADPR